MHFFSIKSKVRILSVCKPESGEQPISPAVPAHKGEPWHGGGLLPSPVTTGPWPSSPLYLHSTQRPGQDRAQHDPNRLWGVTCLSATSTGRLGSCLRAFIPALSGQRTSTGCSLILSQPKGQRTSQLPPLYTFKIRSQLLAC